MCHLLAPVCLGAFLRVQVRTLQNKPHQLVAVLHLEPQISFERIPLSSLNPGSWQPPWPCRILLCRTVLKMVPLHTSVLCLCGSHNFFWTMRYNHLVNLRRLLCKSATPCPKLCLWVCLVVSRSENPRWGFVPDPKTDKMQGVQGSLCFPSALDWCWHYTAVCVCPWKQRHSHWFVFLRISFSFVTGFNVLAFPSV